MCVSLGSHIGVLCVSIQVTIKLDIYHANWYFFSMNFLNSHLCDGIFHMLFKVQISGILILVCNEMVMNSLICGTII